jgi:hypothetical protein
MTAVKRDKSMKKIVVLIVFFFISFYVFAQRTNIEAKSPMSGWRFTEWNGVTLNGKYFGQGEYAESWREQDGYALVSGIRRHYWLYDTYSYRSGSALELFNRIIPSWIEGMGYVIDFDNIQVFNPNESLASSVKALMAQRGCDISLTLVTDIGPYHYVIINNYDRDTGIYFSILYPVYK